jgi:hypothetical protein
MPEFDLGIRQIQFIGEKISLRLKGLSRDQLLRRPSGQANPIIWILGHIATGRGYLLDWIGAGESHPVEDSEEQMFGIGCQLKDGDPYPPMDHLLNMIELRGRAIEERLRALNEEEASKELEFDLPFGKSIRAAVAFMLFHEAMHFGQLSYLCGLEGNPLGV